MGHLTIPNRSQKNCLKAPKTKTATTTTTTTTTTTFVWVVDPSKTSGLLYPRATIASGASGRVFLFGTQGPGNFWNPWPKTRDLNMAVPGVGECGNVNVEYSGDFTFGRLRDSFGGWHDSTGTFLLILDLSCSFVVLISIIEPGSIPWPMSQTVAGMLSYRNGLSRLCQTWDQWFGSRGIFHLFVNGAC